MTLYPMIRRMNDLMNNDFDDMFNFNWMPKTSVTAPAINVKENKNEYDIELAAPGTTKEDFNVNLDNEGNLVIRMEHKGEKNEDKKGHYLRREFSYSNYEQALTLPDDVNRDGIKANVENGVLHVVLPRTAQAQKETKRIEVA